MAQYTFGSGSLWGIQLTTIAGSSVATPTPRRFGVVQEISVDFDLTIKELYGTYQFPVAIGRGEGKISGKAKFAQINALVYNDLFFGQTAPASTQTTIADGEVGTVSTGAITVAHGGNWVRDLGVRYGSNGLPLVATASPAAAGQYEAPSAAAGVYTFSTSDNGASVFLDYEYTASGGYGITVANQLLGNVATFRLVAKAQFSGKTIEIDLFNCISNKLSFDTKLDDFMIPEFDFAAFADASNNLALISTVE